MFDREAVSRNFGDAATGYDAEAALQQRVRAAGVTLAQRVFTPRMHILDAGCGTGALAGEVRWRLTGLDVSEGMCALARARGVEAHRGDAAAMPFADATFDGVFSSLMLQWASSPAQVFSEMARVMKPGGHAVIATLTHGTLEELRQAFAAIDDTPHVSVFAPVHELLGDAAQGGLALVSARQTALVEHYPDAVSLMRSLQAIGATNTAIDRRRGLMTPRQIARLEREYKARFADETGLKASWQVLYLVLQK